MVFVPTDSNMKETPALIYIQSLSWYLKQGGCPDQPWNLQRSVVQQNPEEKQQDLSTRNTRESARSSSTDSHVDLEKATTLHDSSHPSIVDTDALRRFASRATAVSRTRTQGTDGYSAFNVEEEQEEDNFNEVPIQASPQTSQKSAFEVRWDGPNDPECPRNFGKGKKWAIVLITSAGSLCLTCTSSIYTATYTQLMEDFNCSREVVTLGLTLFVLGMGCGPMLLGPLSEFYGRRPIYIVSLFLFLIWLIPCAVAQNIQTMLVARFFDGFVGSAFLSVAAGTIADLFKPQDIELPMMIFTISPFWGPVLGPVLGGLINDFTNWRWTFYTLLIWTAVLLGMIIFMVPETYGKVLLKQRAQRRRKETGNDEWYAPIERMNRTIAQSVVRSCSVPFKLLFWEPMCLLLCLYSALLLGIVYLFFGAFPLVFRVNHGFRLYHDGLTFLGLGIGMSLGVLTNPFRKKHYLRLVRDLEEKTGQKGIQPEPEFRLPAAKVGGVLVPIGIFWFGWTTYPSVHWIVPIIGSGVFGFGLFLAFNAIMTFLIDAYPGYAASALAANTFVRMIFAGAFPLFGVQMYEQLGFQWASSLLGFLAIAYIPLPFLFYRYGKQICARSRFTD